MRVFLYEFLTGGGTLGSDIPLSGSLLEEGASMVSALAHDFGRLPQVELSMLRDFRLRNREFPAAIEEVADAQQRDRMFARLARAAGWTLVIAPELDSLLRERCCHVLASGGRLLSPDPAFVELASDKRLTHRLLQRAGVPVPRQQELRPGEPLPARFPYPAVVKPVDGAGSSHVRLVHSGTDEAAAAEQWRCVEAYCSGEAVSAAVLAGPNGFYLLPACRQLLSDDGRFRYLGGETPLPPPLAARAAQLAQQAAAALPETRGYFGIDLVLGPAADGSQDIVIEVNPRMTTSYVGLRRLARCNLAEAMLAIAAGDRFPLSFGKDICRFGVCD